MLYMYLLVHLLYTNNCMLRTLYAFMGINSYLVSIRNDILNAIAVFETTVAGHCSPVFFNLPKFSCECFAPAKREPSERFGDSTLTQKFIWKKKNEYLQAAGRLPVQ